MIYNQLSAERHEQRREPRVLQIRRVIDIVVEHRKIPFALYNLSSRGAAGRSIFPVKPGARARAHFENGFAIDGCVRWASSGLIGIAFRGTIPDALIRPVSRIRRRRATRFDVVQEASFVVGGDSGPCVIRNVAAGGLMIETPVPLAPGRIVTIITAGLECCGQVRWAADGQAGIRTFGPVDLSAFDVDADGTASAARRRPSSSARVAQPSEMGEAGCANS